MTCNVCQFAMGLAVAGACVVSAASAHADVCGTPTVTTLVAGQHFPAGTVSISNDASYIYVTYHTESPWTISEAHAAVAAIGGPTDPSAGIPQTKSGNPTPGRFSNSATFDPEVMTHTFVIPFKAGQTLFVVAAHAVVQAPRDQGGAQTAWASGTNFPGNNWAMYVSYAVQSCDGGGNA